MPGNLQPLTNNVRIVNPDGTPTEYFIKWAQIRQLDITGGITTAQAQQLIDDWATARSVGAGVGLSGGGSLANDITIDLDASIDDLNDVDTTSTPPVAGDALVFDGTDWVPGMPVLEQLTVATLPAPGSPGRMRAVTDALAPAYLAPVVGGGAVNTPVYDNGVNWVCF